MKDVNTEMINDNCYLGMTIMSRVETEAVVELGVTDRVMWGTDYPHPEGSFHNPKSGDPIVSRLALANACEKQIRDMAGLNAIRCYGLDAAALTKVAEHIGPSIE